MNPLEKIAIKVEPTAGLAPGDGARALLNELERMLQRLLEKGEENSIDLSSLPLSDDDFELLVETLGEGEVTAEVEAVGVAHIQESGIPGIWWVTHLDDSDEVMAQFIEVTYCPELLSAPMEDVKEGLDTLRARLFAIDRGST